MNSAARFLSIAVLTVCEAACAPSQQALLASGGSADFAAMKVVAQDFGEGDADATMSTDVDGQERPFKIWLSKTKPKIMVQNGLNSEIAGAAFTRGLTGGIANSGLPAVGPYQQVAQEYLAANRPGCALNGFYPVTRVGYVWDFVCEDKTRKR